MALGAKNPELFKTTAYKTVKMGKEMPRQRKGGLGTPGGAPVGKPTPTPDMKRVAVSAARTPQAASAEKREAVSKRLAKRKVG